ncbi:MAG: protealysin inhibitor emfourin [Mycobacteriaceae bacterium]
MRIEVTRSGGFAGITRRAVVDTEHRDDAPDWVALAQRAEQPAPDETPVADGFTWTIQVDAWHVVLPDGALQGPLRELAERALAEARLPRPDR